MIRQNLLPQSHTFNFNQTHILNNWTALFCSSFWQNKLYNYIILTSFKGFLLHNIHFFTIYYFLHNTPLFTKKPYPLFYNQRLKKKVPSFFKTLRSLSFKVSEFNSNCVKYHSNYFLHNYLQPYHTKFQNKNFPLLTPFIKKKNRNFVFTDNSFKTKSLNFPNLEKKTFKNRRHWFLSMLTKANVNMRIHLKDTFDSWIKKSLKTQRVKRKLTGKKRIYLFPRQYLLLNAPRNNLKKNKSSKLLLLRRLIKFYRRNLKRIISLSESPLTKRSRKNYKINLLRLKSKRMSKIFKLTTLWRFNSFVKLNTAKIIRRGKSRKKLIRTRKYSLAFFKNNRQNHITTSYSLGLLNYYRTSKARYLRWFIRKNNKRNKSLLLVKSLISSLKKTKTNFSKPLTPVRTPVRFKKNIRKSVTFFKKNFLMYDPIFIKNTVNKSTPQILINPFKQFFKPHSIRSKTSIWSKYKTPFILSNIGFLFIQPINTSINDLVKSKLNRFRYTFFYQNEIKRFFLRKPGNLKLNSSFLTSSRTASLSHFSPYKFFNIDLSNKHGLTSNYSNLLTKQTPFFKYNYSRKYLYASYKFVKTQVNMKRIKFKPGYSRIWRKAREAINKSLNFNSKYQYSLTRYLNQLSHSSKKMQLYLSELTLQKLLLNSKLIHDLNTSKLLINNGLVFVNGQQTFNTNLYLFQNDFIQIIVSLKYYIVHKWLLNWNSFKKIRLIKLSRNKLKKSKNNAHKQKSTHFPDWILESRIKSFDIPKYLEVDFFTLSTFVLYEPFVFNDFNPLNFIESRSTILNMYNWKYIN